MEISQAPAQDQLFVTRFVKGRKIKMAPSQLTRLEREDARKYYNQKIGWKSEEIVKLKKQEQAQLAEVTDLYEKLSSAKEAYYQTQHLVKQAEETLSTFNRVQAALDKYDLLDEGLFTMHVLDKLEKEQTSEEGASTAYKLDQVVQSSSQGDSHPLI